jgi:hypothetical protein
VQDRLVAKIQQQAHTAPGQPVEIDTAQELFIEFDEFLVQLKSSLDYLVKIPTAILGKKTWSMRTFGDKGQRVLRALERNLPRALQVHAKGVKELIIDKHLPWLEWAISLRDSLNHLVEDDFDFEAFAVGWEQREGVWRIHVPQVDNGVTALQALSELWNNLIALVEDFTAGFLVMRIKPGYALYHGRVDLGSAQSPWAVTTKEEMDKAIARDQEITHGAASQASEGTAANPADRADG